MQTTVLLDFSYIKLAVLEKDLKRGHWLIFPRECDNTIVTFRSSADLKNMAANFLSKLKVWLLFNTEYTEANKSDKGMVKFNLYCFI